MSTQPPPPIARRADHTILWVILGVLLFAGVLLFSGIYIFSRYFLQQVTLDIRNTRGDKSVTIQTPAGSLAVDKGELTEQQLGLPIYPGAQRRTREGGTISLEVPSEKSVRVVAAEFESPDSLEQVSAFYRRRLGAAAVERRDRGGVELVIDSGERKKIVLLRTRAGRTIIALASISEGVN